MSEPTTYEYFLDELQSLEKQIHLVLQKEERIAEEKSAFLKEIKSLKNENEILKIKLDEAEGKLERDINPFDEPDELYFENKEVVRNKIDELIIKIDNHLRS